MFSWLSSGILLIKKSAGKILFLPCQFLILFSVVNEQMKLLKFRVSEVFDTASLKNQPIWLEETFLLKWEPFYNDLEKSIKAIPLDDVVLGDLKGWIEYLTSKIDDAQKKGKLSKIGLLFLRHRKILRTRLQLLGLG